MFGDDHDGPPLHVPEEALRRPAGAAVGEDGTVACIACKERFPLSAVDIVGQGYRCAACSHQAHVASLDRGGANVDAGAHLSRGAREDLRRQAGLFMLGGAVLLVVGIGIFVAMLSSGAGTKLGGIVVAGGAGLLITGSMKKQAAGG